MFEGKYAYFNAFYNVKEFYIFSNELLADNGPPINGNIYVN